MLRAQRKSEDGLTAINVENVARDEGCLAGTDERDGLLLSHT